MPLHGVLNCKGCVKPKKTTYHVYFSLKTIEKSSSPKPRYPRKRLVNEEDSIPRCYLCESVIDEGTNPQPFIEITVTRITYKRLGSVIEALPTNSRVYGGVMKFLLNHMRIEQVACPSHEAELLIHRLSICGNQE
jgi:hypothetical protein